MDDSDDSDIRSCADLRILVDRLEQRLARIEEAMATGWGQQVAHNNASIDALKDLRERVSRLESEVASFRRVRDRGDA